MNAGFDCWLLQPEQRWNLVKSSAVLGVLSLQCSHGKLQFMAGRGSATSRGTSWVRFLLYIVQCERLSRPPERSWGGGMVPKLKGHDWDAVSSLLYSHIQAVNKCLFYMEVSISQALFCSRIIFKGHSPSGKIYSKKTKSQSRRDIYTLKFMTALFMVAKT